jgi:hypothetical protein
LSLAAPPISLPLLASRFANGTLLGFPAQLALGDIESLSAHGGQDIVSLDLATETLHQIVELLSGSRVDSRH